MVFLGITILVSLGYVANVFAGDTSMSATMFLVNTLAPSLALNLVFFVLGYFPVESLYLSHRR